MGADPRLSRSAPHEIRILDVLRGQSFSTDKTPLRGDEEQLFLTGYAALIRDYDDLARAA